MKIIAVIMVIISLWLCGCVFIYNTGSADIVIDDNDRPDLDTTVTHL